ncbi:hypothetical protein [Chamaesiphon sp. OTE_75_metabat_556]|uniref:hypothetical protein n=1 Tax=Chamaesiphon sp. OTE_75_metabat_556 TaxID=2964692 RepID=UPI00286B3559|nr:hypothetical protein [Chamaesiphon sp. OTE_75_metabat_556]
MICATFGTRSCYYDRQQIENLNVIWLRYLDLDIGERIPNIISGDRSIWNLLSIC